MDPKEVVAAGYDRMFQRYAEWGDGALRRKWIDRALALASVAGGPPRSALDLGCGTGRHATAYLASLGLDVVGVDISPRSVEAARAEVPDAAFVLGDMATVDLPASSFDVVVALYSVIHLPRDEHAGMFSRIASWLRPGGAALLVLAADAVEAGTDDDWLGGGPMYWSSWGAEESLRLLAEAALDVESASVEVVDEDGTPVPFLWVLAKRGR